MALQSRVTGCATSRSSVRSKGSDPSNRSVLVYPQPQSSLPEVSMRIGIVYPQNELRGDPEAIRSIGLAAEELGYDHLLAYDHVLGDDA